MSNALPTTIDDSLLKYFELQRPPFDRLTDPAELYLTEQHSFLSAHLADAMEESDMLVVICGQPGSGKSSLLKRFSTTVYENICLAAIDNRCTDVTQFFCTVLGQFGFGEISGTFEQLRHICAEFLKQQGKAGDPVVLLVDNAHQLRPEIFEQLRWMAGIRHEISPIVNLVLAGHPDLAKIMDSPAMSQISAKRHVRFNIRAYTEDETANYIWHRLELAGDRQCVQFSDEAHSLIFRYSGGMPALINLICNEALQEVFQQKKKTISGEIVRRVAERHNLIPHVVPVHNKSRRKTDSGYVDETLEQQPSARPVSGEEVIETASPADEPAAATPASNKLEKKQEAASVAATPRQASGSGKRTAASALSIVEKVAALSEQVGDLRARKKDLELELFQRDSAIASLEDRLETERKLHSEAREKLQQDDSESQSLRKKLNKTRNKLKSQLAQSEAIAVETSELRKQLDDAIKGSAELSQALASAESRAEVLSERAELSASLQSALNDRESRVKELQAALNDRDAALQELREQAAQQSAQQTGLIESLQTEVGELAKVQQEKEALQKTIEAQTAEIESLQTLLDEDADEGTDRDTSALKLRLRELEEELKSARQRCEQLEKDKASAGTIETQQADEIAALAEQLAERDRKLQSADKQALAAEEKLAEYKTLVSDLQGQLQTRSEHTDWLKTELARLHDADENLARARIENQTSRKQLLQTEHELGSARSELERLQQELDASKVAQNTLAQQKKAIEAAVKAKEEAEAASAALTQQVADLERRIAEAGDQRSQLTLHAEELAQNKDSLEGMLGDVTTQLAESELRIKSLDENIRQLSGASEQLERENQSLREQLEQGGPFKEEFEKQKALNAKLSKNLDDRTREIAELSTKLGEQAIAHSEATAALAQINKLKPEARQLQTELSAIDEALQKNDEQSRSVARQLQDNDERYRDISGELDSLRQAQEGLRGIVDEAGASVEESGRAQDEIVRLRQALQEADAAVAARGETDQALEKLKAQLEERDGEYRSLAAELEESRAQLNEIQKEFAREAKDNHELQRQLLALADVEEQLREELLHRGELFDDLSAIENEKNQLQEELDRLRRIHESSRDRKKAEAEPRQLPEALKYALEFHHGDARIDTCTLVHEGDKLIVGRGEESDVVVDSEFVSRNHLLISVYRGRLFVKDLHSTNGTFVNGKRVSHCEMKDGDTIKIGEHSISVVTSQR